MTHKYETTISIGGEEHQIEVDFEVDPDRSIEVDRVVLLHLLAGENGIWYDDNGTACQGPHWIETDITIHISPALRRALCEEAGGREFNGRTL